MRGKQFKWVLTFRRTAKAILKTNKLYYTKKADAEHDLKQMKTKYPDMYKNPHISKL